MFLQHTSARNRGKTVGVGNEVMYWGLEMRYAVVICSIIYVMLYTHLCYVIYTLISRKMFTVLYISVRESKRCLHQFMGELVLQSFSLQKAY